MKTRLHVFVHWSKKKKKNKNKKIVGTLTVRLFIVHDL